MDRLQKYIIFLKTLFLYTPWMIFGKQLIITFNILNLFLFIFVLCCRYYFRLSRRAFEKLLQIISPQMQPKSTGRHGTSPEKALLVLLQYLGTQETYSSIAQRFGIPHSLAHKIVRKLLCLLVPHVSSMYITWPSTDEFFGIASGFKEKSPHMPAQIAGAVDCREIPIITPKEDPASYYNRKHFHSVKLQAIVDNAGNFRDTFIGWPGRSHDARSFVNSPIYTKLETVPHTLPTNFF
jgi:hypothetical protein